MTRPVKLAIHAGGAALAVVAAVCLVQVRNRSYWDEPTFPNGTPAREMKEEYRWLEPGIDRLVATYSVPFAISLFLAMYGLLASLLEVEGGLRFLVPAAFLYVLPGVLCGHLLFVLLPGTVLVAALLALSIARRNKRAVVLSALALGHNILFVVVGFLYLGDWYGVFGD